MFNLLDPKPLFAPTPGCTATSCFQYGEDCGWDSGEFFTSFLFKRRQNPGIMCAVTLVFR